MKPLFLLSNDDGLHAKGMRVLLDIVRPLGDVVVVVPDQERSGQSTAFTSTSPLMYRLVSEEPGLRIYTCNGTPVDCVKMALSLIFTDRQPDYVISGINHGYNGSVSIHYSGTLGVAMEGCMSDIPSVAFSLDDHSPAADFSRAVPYIQNVLDELMRRGLPRYTCLNVNIPKGEPKGVRLCRQGMGRYQADFHPANYPRHKETYWLTGHFVRQDEGQPDTDLQALQDGYVSIVPQQVDCTSYHFLEELKDWNLQ